MDKHSYVQLVDAAVKGDREALNKLIETLTIRLRSVVKHRVGWWPEQEQEDLIQSTLVVFVEKLGDIRSNPCAFIVQILSNRIGNELQKKRRRRDVSIVNGSDSDEFAMPGVLSLTHSPELAADASPERLHQQLEIQVIIRAIDRLSPFCRTVFKGIIEGLAIGDIWADLSAIEPSLTRNAFDKRIFECRKRLRLLTEAA